MVMRVQHRGQKRAGVSERSDGHFLWQGRSGMRCLQCEHDWLHQDIYGRLCRECATQLNETALPNRIRKQCWKDDPAIAAVVKSAL